MPEFMVVREFTALIVVDMQPDFMPGGSLAVKGGDEIVPGVASLMPCFYTVVATQDWHPAGHISFASSHEGCRPFEVINFHGNPQTLWPDHCVIGTPGAALHPGLPTDPISLVLRKGTNPKVDSYSAFHENHDERGFQKPTGLAGYLRDRGITTVVVVGLAKDVCVRWTIEGAIRSGFKAVLVDDLSRSVFPDNDPSLHDFLQSKGVIIVNSQELSFLSDPR